MNVSRHYFLALQTVLVSVFVASCSHVEVSTSTPLRAANLTCDDSLKMAFRPDAETQVLLVKSFKMGEPLRLSGTVTTKDPVAANDMCLVKLLVGPGNPGPVGAPSTSAGIGIEVWLPSPSKWNDRIHVQGNGGWAGGPQATLTSLELRPTALPAWTIAGVEGAVSASTDTGHTAERSGAFAMNPDGTINQAGWRDFAHRSIHEMAVKTKALTAAYYGRPAKWAYWRGASTGGRQGLKLAQAYPTDFNGIIANWPAVNWSRFVTSEVWPQLVQERDLNGVHLTKAQLDSVSVAAIHACDVVGGQHLGYLLDPRSCTYDPMQDANVLCAADGGKNATAACVTRSQATVINKIWYGPTSDNSVPSPRLDNGLGATLASQQRWYGPTRDTDLNPLAGAVPFSLAIDYLALELQDPTLAPLSFLNATGNGQNRWKTLSYAEYFKAMDRGIALQDSFGNIDTDSPDLSAFKAAGGKLITVYGWSDSLIPPGGFIHYYERVAAAQAGLAHVQEFFRLFMVPGQGHGRVNGTANPSANPPLPDESIIYSAMTDWVEKGIAPKQMVFRTTATAANPTVKSMPMCPYPQKATYGGGDVTQASSYTCR
jgi:feruloyl esterase